MGRVEQRTVMITWERKDNAMVGMELPEGAELNQGRDLLSERHFSDLTGSHDEC